MSNRRVYFTEYKRRRREEGLCKHCGAISLTFSHCLECRLRMQEQRALKRWKAHRAVWGERAWKGVNNDIST